MGPGRTLLFALLSGAAGCAAYWVAARHIEATSHTVPYRPSIYVAAVVLALLLTAALRVAWPKWGWWSVPVALILMAAAFFGLYMMFFLPFP